MTKEQKLIDAALKAGKDVLTALDAAIDTLLMKGERDPLLAIHEALHKVVEARDALEVVLGALKGLEGLHRVERLERGDKGA
jgi:alpha-beta hydrolase superfamily lysophospholipase